MTKFNFTWGLPELEELGFAQVYVFMLRSYAQLGLSRQEMLCLIHLASYHFNSPRGESKPSLTTIAEEMGYGDRKRVSDLVRSLEDKGMLEVKRQTGLPSVYDASPFARATLQCWLEGVGRSSAQEGGRSSAQESGAPAPTKKKKEEEDKQTTAAISPFSAAEPLVLDLDEEWSMVGDHGVKKEETTAQCPCGIILTQLMAVCPDCQRMIVWRNSKVWKREYGKPENWLRDNTWQRPGDTYAQKLFARLRLVEFASKTDAKSWTKLVRDVPGRYINWAIDYVTGEKQRTGYSAISYVINAARKKQRDEPKFEEHITSEESYEDRGRRLGWTEIEPGVWEDKR